MNPNPYPVSDRAISISDTIPLYLADKLSLDEAVHILSTPDPSTSKSKRKKDILLAILSEAKSLPRETDTHPTSPTPDLPSPAQERLLELVRRVQENTELELALSRSSRDSSGYGYGIELDAGGDGDGHGGVDREEQEKEEEYELLKDIIRASFPAFPPPTSPSVSYPIARAKGRGSDVYREQREPENPNDDPEFSTSPFDSTPSSSSHPLLAQPPPPPPPPHLQTISSSHRRTSSASGPSKQFNNQVSFLAFLTKEQLLLSPGVGERVAIEMVRDTLSHHGSSIHSHQQASQQQQHDFSGGGGGGSQSPPWFGDAGPASIAAAALWMIIMGEELYVRIREQERERDSRVGTGSVKGGGRPGGIAHEWETWTARLQYLSLRDDLSLEARECAAEGAAVMRRV